MTLDNLEGSVDSATRKEKLTFSKGNLSAGCQYLA